MKKIFALLILLLALSSARAQTSEGCGLPCLSQRDQLTISHARETLDSFVRDAPRYLPALRNATINDGDTAFRSTSRYLARHADDLIDLRRKAESVHLRRVLGRYANALTELSELLDAGATLIVAKRENNYALIGGAAKTFVTRDAKELLAPVGSLVEIQMRADRLLRLVPVKVQYLQDEISQARREFWEKTGVDIVPN